ncbi:MAG: acetyltransferase [Lachnospiraceae bacterium]|nr:acetyltransferase [Lachnospiraceae bacterium]
MKDLYIIGAGGLGRETSWIAETMNQEKETWNIKGFIDDNVSVHGKVIDDYPVLGGLGYLSSQKEAWVICAIGSSAVKKKVIDKIGGMKQIHYASIISPQAVISRHVKVGEGCIIFPGNVITVDVTVGKHVLINPGCTIGHDVVIRDYATIYSAVSVSGNVTVGSATELGVGSRIIQGKKIGDRTIIGAGAIVIRDIESDCTAVGCPAKVIKRRLVE